MPEQIEGRRPVLEALAGRRGVRRVVVAEDARGSVVGELIRAARDSGVPVERAGRAWLDRRARSRAHQGVIAMVEPLPHLDLDDLLERAAAGDEAPLLLVCAEVQDPQNLGALLRTAEAAGAHGVVVPRRRSAPLGAAVARASAGALEHVPVARVTNLRRALNRLQAGGVWACAADPRAANAYFESDLTGPLALVVGGEGRGIPRLVREHCDFGVRIPMQGRVASLNASVAGALLLYETLRQRRSGSPVTSRADLHT